MIGDILIGAAAVLGVVVVLGGCMYIAAYRVLLKTFYPKAKKRKRDEADS